MLRRTFIQFLLLFLLIFFLLAASLHQHFFMKIVLHLPFVIFEIQVELDLSIH